MPFFTYSSVIGEKWDNFKAGYFHYAYLEIIVGHDFEPNDVNDDCWRTSETSDGNARQKRAARTKEAILVQYRPLLKDDHGSKLK